MVGGRPAGLAEEMVAGWAAGLVEAMSTGRPAGRRGTIGVGRLRARRRAAGLALAGAELLPPLGSSGFARFRPTHAARSCMPPLARTASGLSVQRITKGLGSTERVLISVVVMVFLSFCAGVQCPLISLSLGRGNASGFGRLFAVGGGPISSVFHDNLADFGLAAPSPHPRRHRRVPRRRRRPAIHPARAPDPRGRGRVPRRARLGWFTRAAVAATSL